jgi:hypothetical protein
MRRIFIASLCFLAACTFPDVTIDDRAVEDGGDAVASDTSVASDGSGGDVGDVAKQDEGVVDSGSIVDSSGIDGSGIDTKVSDTPIDFGPEATVCDNDGDHYQKTGPTCTPPTGMVDCDDQSASVNPGVKGWIIDLPPTTSPLQGDWNCDGKVDKQYTTVVSCAGLSVGCTGRGGVRTVADCGRDLVLVDCVTDTILGCKESPTTKAAKQGCL